MDHYECHCHIALDGDDFKNVSQKHKNGADETLIRKNLEEYKKRGIKYIRDGGDKWGASRLAKGIACEYGIEYKTPVFPIFRRKNYGGFIGVSYETVSDFYALVKRAKKEGADFIKLMASGIMDFSNPGELTGFGISEELPEIVKICHGEGFAVMMHVNGADAVKAAVSAQADSIEHGNYLDDAAIADIALSDAVWVPTVTATANLIGSGLFPDNALKSILAVQLENIKKASARGADIALGSDAGAKCVLHGKGVTDEAGIIESLVGKERIIASQEKLRNMFRAV